MWKAHAKTLNYISLCLLVCFPAFSLKMTVALIIAFSALSVCSGLLADKPVPGNRRFRELWLLLLPFVLIFIRTFVTDRSEPALFYLEVSMSLLAFPIAFYLSPIRNTARQRDWVSTLFVISSIGIALYGQLRSAIRLAHYVGSGKFYPKLSDLFADPAFSYHLRTLYEEYTGTHPTYACIFLGISFLLTLDGLLRKWETLNRGKRYLYTLVLLVLLFCQAVLASRTPFVATMVSGTLLLVIHSRKKRYALYALGAIAAVSVMLWVLVPSFSNRFSEISISNTTLPTGASGNSFNIRTGIYKCSMEIIGDHWLWGLGPGHVQDALNTCYYAISPEVYGNKNYNTHNQYLDYWAGLGILGPLSLLAILVYTSVRNFRSGNGVVPAISLFFTIAFLTENLLSRQNGIVCFALFTGLHFFTETPVKRTVRKEVM